MLRGHGFRAEHYHAGLEAQERTRVQDDFVSGATQVVVATTAFGMGIDKPDVRLVCLVNYPDSLEGYVQMVGRAGRDGEPSQTLLLASPSDATALRRFAVSDVPTASELRAVYRALRDAGRARRPGRARVARAGARRARPRRDARAGGPPATRSFDEGGRMRIELRRRRPTRASASRRSSTARGSSPSRAPTASSRSPRRACAGTSRSPRTSARIRRPVRRLRRLRAARPRIRVGLEPAAAAARRRRRGDRRRGRLAHVAARSAEPRRDAARVAEGASVGAPFRCLPAARGRDRRATSAAG